MTPERLLRRRPLSLDDVPGFAGGNLGEQVDGQSPDRMAGVASSPVRRVAFPSAGADTPPPIERDPYEGARNPSIPTLAQVGAPPTMIQRNNKGRPVAIIGGDDRVAANQELIRAQEGYKAPRSTKDQILAFLTGGIPGGIAYATDQNTRNRWAVGEDISKEQGQIGQELALRKSQNDLLNDQTERGYKEAQTQKLNRVVDPQFNISPGQERVEIGADGQPHIIYSRPPSPRASQKPPVKQADEQGNEYLADAETGEPLRDRQGNIRYSARAKPPKPDETPKDFSTRQRNYQAAKSKYEGLIAEEKAAAKAKDAAFAAYSQARAKYGSIATADIQPDVIAAKAAADRAQATYASFWGKKDAAKAEMIQHGDGVDANGEPLPPKPLARGNGRGNPAPTTHGFSISGWLAKNPGKTEVDAKAFHDNDSKYRAFQIIP